MKIDFEKLSAGYVKGAILFRKGVFDAMSVNKKVGLPRQISLGDVKKAVVISAASRSGSSLLFALLKQDPHFYAMAGESTPFYKLNGLSSDQFPSDEIPQELMERTDYIPGLSRDILSDLSCGNHEVDVFNDDTLSDGYADDLALRFALQWPQVDFNDGTLRGLTQKVLNAYRKNHKIFRKELFYLELLRVLRQVYHDINPYYYDIPEGMIRRKFPDVAIPQGPPNNIFMIEEPPFILLSPRRRVDRQTLSDKIFLMKTSADAYRMDFIEKLLPNAEIKVVHLVRNPAASINGLYDGWRYRGFFSHNLETFFKSKIGKKPGMLAIGGYSERHLSGKWWWKYDLPPGWQAYVRQPLEKVCAFQWYAANKAIQEYLQKTGKKVCRVKYEDIIDGRKRREELLAGIKNFAGIQDHVSSPGPAALPVIQATQPPKAQRWRHREGLIRPLINSQNIRSMCQALGYDPGRFKEWL